MRIKTLRALLGPLALLAFAGCGQTAKLYPQAGMGPHPTLPPPNPTKTTVKVAPAKGWDNGAAPLPASGLAVKAFADGLDHPRWLYVLPNGDVLVAETNAPERPEEGKNLQGKIMKVMMKKAGAGVPSANRITLLRDADGDGQAEVKTVFLKDLNSPFGMVLVGEELFIANTDAVVKVPYKAGETEITATPTKVADLPAGPLNH